VSERIVRTVVLDSVEPHPNADRLDVAKFGGFVCVVARDTFRAGDAATYIPVDMLVPADRPEFAFLAVQARKSDGRCRIKARDFRGVYSEGLLLPARTDEEITALGVEPYVAPWEMDSQGLDAKSPSPEPPVYDLESWRTWGHLFKVGEPVAVTEKLNGSSGRFFRDLDGHLHLGSHTRWKLRPEDGGNSEWAHAVSFHWWNLARIPSGTCVYWECIGRVGGFGYGIQKGTADLRVFDVRTVATGGAGEWQNWPDARRTLVAWEIPVVPTLYEGPYDPGLVQALAEGQTTMGGGHVREGIVIRPTVERWEPELHGRLVLKLHGKGFRLGKG